MNKRKLYTCPFCLPTQQPTDKPWKQLDSTYVACPNCKYAWAEELLHDQE